MLNVVAGEANASAYQRLLLSDWKRDFPDEVLALLSSTLGAGHGQEGDPLWKLLTPGSNGVFPVDFFRSLLHRIDDATRFVLLADLPPLPQDYDPPRRLSKSAWQAVRLTTYLTLQANAELSGDVAFFQDVQALAFQAAIHYVLPPLQERHAPEYTILLHALVLFPLEYYAADPGYFSYLLSMIHDYLGNVDQRLRFLQAAVRFTPPEDHAFLTRAQEFWSELLDHKRYEEAERFLVALPAWSLPSQQDEVRAMVIDAFKFILADKPVSR
jgi:hypothetical protein